MNALETPRLLLIPGIAAHLDAELVSARALADSLGARVPASWPPELYDAAAVAWTRDRLRERPDMQGWALYYIAERPRQGDEQPRLIGAGGFKGPPDESGAVEIGYSVLGEFRRRGYASEAVEGWLAHAFADPRVKRVLAHTLRELQPSIGVLEKAGFVLTGAGFDPDEPDAIRYELTRDAWSAHRARR